MPMIFTPALVVARAAELGIPVDETMTIAELREMVAQATEQQFHDAVEGQEIRSGRPWTAFTVDDMHAIEERAPGYWRRNPGLLRRRIELGMLDNG